MRVIALSFALLCAAPWWISAAERTDKLKDSKKDDERWGTLEYRQVGPTITGRVARVAGVAGDPLTYYAATAQGGVWKSINGGQDWAPIFDSEITQSIGSIAVAPSDPSVIYVGSGEANIRGNVAIGHGIFVSRDAGKTWQHAWKTKGQIGTMAVHPRDADIAFAAVLGSPFGPNADRGVYRTQDGGKTWHQVLKVDADTGASDVAIDPNRPAVIYAGMWQTRRQPWHLSTAGKGSGLYRSSDGGDTWDKVEHEGLPKGDWGKVGIAIAPSDSMRLYAMIEAKEGGLFRSDDGGDSWKLQNDHHALRQRSWYYSTLTIDPKNPDIVWMPQVPLLRSIDGGKTIQQVSGGAHGDNHDIWIDPADTRRLIVGNDGGMDISRDGGKSWYAPSLPLAQLYNIDVDNRVPYHVGGTMQDMGTFSGSPSPRFDGGNTVANWSYVGGGEAGDFLYDRAKIGEIYAGEYSGYISHYVEGSGEYRNITAYPANNSGHGAEDLKIRFQWTAPIAASPHDTGTIYHGANVLLRSSDQGNTWAAISPDLTRNDKSKQKWSGGPITGDNTGVEIYDTIFSIAESPVTKGMIWVGSDDGLIHVTRDGGGSWSNVTSKTWPEWATVEAIEPSRRDAAVAYAVIDGHRINDFRPYLFVTRDFGKNWKRIVEGLPDDMQVFVVREDEQQSGLLYLGGERGVFVSRNDGAHWEPLQLNLPPVAVVDIEAKHDDLILGTRGRSVWILDDVSALRALDEAARTKDLQLFAAKPALRLRKNLRWDSQGKIDDAPYGAQISYWLKEKSETPLTLEIRDSQGNLVRTLSSIAKPARWPEDDADEPTKPPKPELTLAAGLQRAVWDLSYEGARIPVGAKVDAGDPEQGAPVLPGVYTLRLLHGDQIAEGKVEVRIDPEETASLADLSAALEFQMTLRDALNRNADAIDLVRAAREQAADLIKRLKDTQPEIVKAAQATVDRSDAIEAKLHNPNAKVVYDILAFEGGAQLYSQISPLYAFALQSDRPPPQGQRERWAELQPQLDALLADIEALKQNEISALETALANAKIPRLILPTP
jgi:photosystem II stability/assembly factor-like uncharacterized protein